MTRVVRGLLKGCRVVEVCYGRKTTPAKEPTPTEARRIRRSVRAGRGAHHLRAVAHEARRAERLALDASHRHGQARTDAPAGARQRHAHPGRDKADSRA